MAKLTTRKPGPSMHRSRSKELSRVFEKRVIAHGLLTRCRPFAKHSVFKDDRTNRKDSFPLCASPFLVQAALMSVERSIPRYTSKIVDGQTKTIRDTSMRDEATAIVQPRRSSYDASCFPPRNYHGLTIHALEEESVDAENTSQLAQSEKNLDNTEDPRYKFGIISHRIKDKTQVELETKSTSGSKKSAFVDEHTLQQDWPLALYGYWKSIGGREAATGIKLFHIFQIRRWRAKEGKLQFLVQWVGYPPEDSTWEFARRVKMLAEEMHTCYLETHPSARSAWEEEGTKK